MTPLCVGCCGMCSNTDAAKSALKAVWSECWPGACVLTSSVPVMVTLADVRLQRRRWHARLRRRQWMMMQSVFLFDM
jgi:hypothetical protein